MSLTEKLLLEFGPDIRNLTLIPGANGVFDVRVNDTLAFSTFRDEGFPQYDSIRQSVRDELK